MRDTALATKGASMSWEVEQIGSCTLYRGDAYTIVPTLQGVHALITDPPYGIKFDWLNASRTRATHASNGLCRPIPVRWHANIAGDEMPFDPAPWLAYPQVIFWGAQHFAAQLPNSPAWLIWDKRDGRTPDDYGDCELAWTNLGGVTRLHYQLWRGLIRAGEENLVHGPKLHPAQKPVKLMRWCIQKTTGLVLDPFAGSCTTALGCLELGRPCIAIEIDPVYWERGCERLAAAARQGRLFPVPACSRTPLQEVLL